MIYIGLFWIASMLVCASIGYDIGRTVEKRKQENKETENNEQ